MPLFRRRPHAPEAQVFRVGVDDHRVVVGGAERGCELLEEIDGYIAAATRRGSTRPDGRDTTALLNAKMDYAEMCEAAVSVMVLAVEELVQAGILADADVPPRPAPIRFDHDLATYDYIQSIYARAQERVAWLHRVDAVLRERGIAVLRPAPVQRGP